MATLPLTYEQIVEIFNEGCRRGEEEATAYEWGSTPAGTRDAALADALYDIFNAGKDFDDPARITFAKPAEMWAAALTNHTGE